MKPSALVCIALLVCSFTSIISALSQEEASDEVTLTVYCYDSFSSEWGPGPAIAEAFYQSTGIRIVFNAPGDAVTVLNQLILEKDSGHADVVVGLDENLLDRALNAEVLAVYESVKLSRVPPDLIFDKSHHLLPFDYGHFAICYDSQVVKNPPTSLEDLTSGQYAKSLVIMDPRTSTPGLGFLLWTVAAFGEQWPDYWRELIPTILTVANGWSQGYVLFTAGEASMVLSYGTSPAYHVEYENSHRYKVAEFSDGHPVQIEGMGIVKGAKHRKEAELFIDFMLGMEAQYLLATRNIMLPVNQDVVLPDSFNAALRPAETIDIDMREFDSARIDQLIRQWREVF